MKNYLIQKFLVSVCAIAALASCNSSKMKQDKMADDCSTIFQTGIADKMASDIYSDSQMTMTSNKANMPAACKVMQVKIDKNTNCKISGSNRIENLLDFYGKNFSSNRVVLYAPTDQIIDSTSISFKNLLALYNIKMDIKKHIDSDLFEPLKDYKYKGMHCKLDGGEITAWVGDEKVLVAIDGQIIEKLVKDSKQTVDKTKNKVKKTYHHKVTKTKKAK